MQFEIVTPEKPFYSGEVKQALVPGASGDFGVLPGHSPVIASLRAGVVEIALEDSDEQKLFLVRGGFAEAAAARCIILADDCVEITGTTREAVASRLITASNDEETAAIISEITTANGVITKAAE